MSIKKIGRAVICGILESQVRALRRRHTFTVVAVTGSVGKTSTKAAIAKLLSSQKRVVYQEGNYNDRLTVPLVLFGQDHPGLFNMVGWARVFWSNLRQIYGRYPYDLAVLELGSDAPGQIDEFAYLSPDIAVVTAVSAEHMENFHTLAAVAKEELAVASFSKRLLINGDDVAMTFREHLQEYTSYGLNSENAYRATYTQGATLEGERVTFLLPGGRKLKCQIAYLGDTGVKIVLSALAVADLLGIDVMELKKNAESLRPFPGRMQILPGKNGSLLIDDTYNSSPLAIKAALDVLYASKATRRIAILGSMNELGETSRVAHEEAGAYCDPDKLAVVATVGAQANEYLAPAAQARGCKVIAFASPYEAGKWALGELDQGTVLLAKGSQNGVFTEEALKPLLQNPDDTKRLVRQSASWLRVKKAQFPD